jgi:hypothetical protein
MRTHDTKPSSRPSGERSRYRTAPSTGNEPRTPVIESHSGERLRERDGANEGRPLAIPASDRGTAEGGTKAPP